MTWFKSLFEPEVQNGTYILVILGIMCGNDVALSNCREKSS